MRPAHTRPSATTAAPSARAWARHQVAAPPRRNAGPSASAREHRAALEGHDRPHPDQRQGHVERGEDGEAEERVVQPGARVHQPPVQRVDRGDQRARGHRGQEDHVRRVEGRRRVVGREHEEQQVVIERLDRVVGRGQHDAPAALEQRRAQLGDQHEEQPEQQQVADDPPHVGQAPPEHEEGGQPQGQRDDRDGPAPEPAHDRQAGGARRGRLGHVAAGTAGAGIPCLRQ